jgi:hypothetical protein
MDMVDSVTPASPGHHFPRYSERGPWTNPRYMDMVDSVTPASPGHHFLRCSERDFKRIANLTLAVFFGYIFRDYTASSSGICCL